MEYCVTYNYLEHHGIRGQKWGVRRYQNQDGTLTDAGRKRYDKQVQQVEKRYDPNAKNTLFRVSRNKNLLDRAKNKYASSEKKVEKLKNKDANQWKIEKMMQKSKKNFAELKKEEALQKVMKQMEMININDGSYAHNKRVNLGISIAKEIEAKVMAIGMAALTGGVGIGIVSRDRREGTSLTKEQLRIAEVEAQKAYNTAMNNS